MKHIFLIVLTVFLTGGCISVDYVGKSYPATSSVKTFTDKTKIPFKYTVMGKARATANYSYSEEEIKNKLASKAEAEGADAVLILTYGIVPDGDCREDQLLDSAPAMGGTADDDDSRDNVKNMEQNFNYRYGQIGRKQQGGMDVQTYKRVITALFIKYKE